jgi:hypothetical protein
MRSSYKQNQQNNLTYHQIITTNNHQTLNFVNDQSPKAQTHTKLPTENSNKKGKSTRKEKSKVEKFEKPATADKPDKQGTKNFIHPQVMPRNSLTKPCKKLLSEREI